MELNEAIEIAEKAILDARGMSTEHLGVVEETLEEYGYDKLASDVHYIRVRKYRNEEWNAGLL